ncbi:ferredoxin [Pseudonocardia ammonioxydans]|uniref:Ferredoxin n=1 Tax=Pseudonocardia ammonioxydans TaxID=260086 RepID=A0A1I5HAI1_PSUAM|nr:ferredoxin [Pseudonocardia ammonioxydans]SFO44831.1 ferredoxin [Pseudonocardia ammonioxydans]
MKVHIDTTRCTGHGLCEAVAEDIFEVGDDGMAHLLADPDADRRGEVDQAVAECPTRALSASG